MNRSLSPLIACILAICAGCGSSRPITPASVENVGLSNVSEVHAGALVMKIASLPRADMERVLNAHVNSDAVLTVAFSATNTSASTVHVARSQFRLAMGGAEIEPALPGRAANLLRDGGDIDVAALVGVLLVGGLAAPSIHAAQRREEAIVEENTARVFSETDLLPGQTVTAYVIFETPTKATDEHPDWQLRFTPSDAAMSVVFDLHDARSNTGRTHDEMVDGHHRDFHVGDHSGMRDGAGQGRASRPSVGGGL